MAITYSWDILNLESQTTQDGLDDVVFKVAWLYQGVDSENDSDGNPYQGSFSDATVVGSPDPDSFTAYADVTKSQCQAWVIAALADEEPVRSGDTLKAKVDAQIARKKNPPEVWGTPAAWND